MTSRHQAVEVYSLLMNIMMLVPSTQPGIPCYSCPSLSPYDFPHKLRYLGIFMRCRISISSPVSSSTTVLRICIGDFILARLSGVNSSCSVSKHANIAYCINARKRVLRMVLYFGACRVLMPLFIFSSTLINAASIIFGYSTAVNLVDC